MRYAVMLLWCPLLQGRAQPCTDEVDSAALLIAERRKLAAYPERRPSAVAGPGNRNWRQMERRSAKLEQVHDSIQGRCGEDPM